MADLSDYRKEIDAIDLQLTALFEQRMEIVKLVGAYKKERGLPVLQADREREVLDRAENRLGDRAYAPQIRRLMSLMMEMSRTVQREGETPVVCPPGLDGAVGFYGAEGSFSEEAAQDYFGEGRVRKSYTEFSDVCEALRTGEIDYGVLPIENSSTGAISQVYDLLGRYGFYIVGERRLRIRQNLVATADATPESIRTVYSHPQGLEQSRAFLAQHGDWELIPFCSTAMSAKRVAEENSPSKAAIASERAAALYGLRILASEVQDSGCNSTRFIIIGRTLETQSANKISLMFSLDNEAGTLYRILHYFAEQQINLVKIESRPIPEKLWNYLFYLDFEGDPNSEKTQTVLSQVTCAAKTYRLLGAYRSDSGKT